MERPFLFAYYRKAPRNNNNDFLIITNNNEAAMIDTNTVLISTKANPTRLIHHYTPIAKLGFPEGRRCWCGALLEFGVKESYASKDKRRKEFFDKHDECDAPKEGK
jgi:hypothetical protein